MKSRDAKKVAKGKTTQKRQRTGQSSQKPKKLTVPVGSRIWDNLEVAFHIFDHAVRIWKRISGSDNSP